MRARTLHKKVSLHISELRLVALSHSHTRSFYYIWGLGGKGCRCRCRCLLHEREREGVKPVSGRRQADIVGGWAKVLQRMFSALLRSFFRSFVPSFVFSFFLSFVRTCFSAATKQRRVQDFCRKLFRSFGCQAGWGVCLDRTSRGEGSMRHAAQGLNGRAWACLTFCTTKKKLAKDAPFQFTPVRF